MNLRERICEQGRCCPGTVGYPANADPTICIEHAIYNLRRTEQTHRQQMQQPGIIIILVMSMPKTCVQFVGSLFSGSKKRLNTDQQFSFPLIIIELWKWWDDQWPLGLAGHQGVPKEFHVYTRSRVARAAISEGSTCKMCNTSTSSLSYFTHHPTAEGISNADRWIFDELLK